MQNSPLLIDARDAGRLLNMPPARITRLAKRGLLPRVVLPDGDFQFVADDLRAWADEHRHPELVVADEVTHWRKRDLWDSLISSAAKRSTCMFVVIANAGLQDDWQWTTREAVRADPSWYFSRLDGPVASWITPDRLAEQERLLPSIAYQRLWLNIWTTGGGDALTEADINAAFVEGLRRIQRAAPGFEYVGGLDLGVSRDASAVCILGVRRGREGHGRIRLAYTRIWRPRKGQKVDLQQIEDTLFDLNDLFQIKALNFDPWQATHMSQRLQAGGFGRIVRGRATHVRLPMVEVTQSGQNLQRMATVLIEAFNDRRLELFDDPDLRRDLTRLRIEERSYGFRLVAPRDATGHGDLGTAFSLAMLGASELAGKCPIRVGAIPIDGGGLSAAERAARAFERRQAAYELLDTGDSDNRDGREELRALMRLVGR